MELTFLQQSLAFLYSLILGICVGLVYGLIKALRVFFCKGKISTFISDFLFMLVTFVLIFIFSISYLQGYVRLFEIFGTFFGILMYHYTIGRLSEIIFYPIIKKTLKLADKIILKIKFFVKKLLKNMYKILYNTINSKIIYRNKRDSIKNNEVSINDVKQRKKKKIKKLSGFSTIRKKQN